MNKSLFRFACLLIAAAVSSKTVAVTYNLPAPGSRLVGDNLEITIPADSKLPLEAFAAQYQMGLSNMLEANPGVDVYLPPGNSKLIIPQQLLLPDAPREGIIINSAEMRLYYYPKGKNTVVVLPIGIGELGKDTPLNWVTKVERKKQGPTWTPTKKMHEEYAARGEHLPAVFPSGPDNPMGLYALYVGRLYAVHGTNANFGIGLRVSHGCVRLRAGDIEWLFNNVPVGTRVQFINQPVKASVEPDGSRLLEVHDPLSRTQEQFDSHQPVPLTLTPEVEKVIADSSVLTSSVEAALNARSGMPVKINGNQQEQASKPLPVQENANAQPVENATTPAGEHNEAAPAATETQDTFVVPKQPGPVYEQTGVSATHQKQN